MIINAALTILLSFFSKVELKKTELWIYYDYKPEVGDKVQFEKKVTTNSGER